MGRSKVIFVVLLSAFFVFISCQSSLATEKKVKLTVPGCV